MSRANDNAYPVDSLALTPNGTVQMGLTIREHFAAMAMQGFIANGEWAVVDITGHKIAEFSVQAADDLIRELAK